MKVPVKIQLLESENAATCLNMIFAAYGLFLSNHQINLYFAATRSSGTLETLLRVAERFHMKARETSLTFAAFSEKMISCPVAEQRPCIIGFRDGSYAIVTKFTQEKVYVNDPVYGAVKLKPENFEKRFSGRVIMIEPDEGFVAEGREKTLLDMLKERLSGFGRPVMGITALTLLGAFLDIWYLAWSRSAIDDLMGGEYPEWFGITVIMMAAIFVVNMAVSISRTLMSFRTSYHLARSSSHRVFHKLLHLPMQFFSTHYIGEITQRVDRNQSFNESLVNTVLPEMITLFTTSFYALIIFWYSVPLSLALIGAEAVFFMLNGSIRKKIRAISRTSFTAMGSMESFLLHGLDSLESIKASASEQTYFDNWSRMQATIMGNRLKGMNILVLSSTLSSLHSTVISAIILFAGAFLIMKGQFTTGMLFLFQSLYARVQSAMGQVTSMSNRMQEMRTDLERVDDLMENESRQVILQDDEQLQAMKTDGTLFQQTAVSADRVSYKYGMDEPNAISGISLQLQPGEIIALVGESGCGKSTLMKCIAGINTPTEGEIRYFGFSRDRISNNTFSAFLGFVDQDIVMFEDTIRNNLTMWNDSIPESELVAACRTAEIYDRVNRVREGFDMKISPNGRNFSSGELQRLELARALIQKPRILLLDEFTSALDSLTEKKIFENLRASGITCIIAAHRLSTVASCDRVIVMEHGSITESGTHEELLRRGGTYAALIKNG